MINSFFLSTMLILFAINIFINIFIFKHAYNYCFNIKINKINYTYIFIVSFIDLLIFIKYKYSIDTIKYLLLIYLLTYLSITDILDYLIPDFIIILIIILRLIFMIIEFDDIIYILFNALFIPFVLLIIINIYKTLLHKDVMGGGDIKLLFVLGTYSNLFTNILILLVSCIISLIYVLLTKKKDNIFPFGPFISISFILLTLIF